MTQEEKAKAYDRVSKEVKDFFEGRQKMYSDVTQTLEYLFPELKESKDEKIRKDIIGYIKGISKNEVCEETKDSWIAWLEKQKTSKEALQYLRENHSSSEISDFQAAMNIAVAKAYDKGYNDGLEKQGGQKPTNEPKYKVGDIIRRKEGDGLEWTVEEVFNNGYYTIVCANRDDFILLDDNWELVEQKPDDKIEPKFNVGDKIQYLKGCGTIMTIEKIENGEYIFANNLGHTTIEDGNKWYLVERNHTWSEEDEMFVHGLIRGLAAKRDIHGHTTFSSDCIDITETIDWLKSLQDRVQPQPKREWNKEDEDILNTIINHFEIDLECTENDDIIMWLKSLRPQNRWKPSDEQMKVLKELVEDNNQRYFYTLLKSLYDQLKILKGE